MSSKKERVFVIGASGNIGSGVVRGLVKKGVETTAYVRNEQKAKDLFKDELSTGHLTIVIGTYSSFDVYTKAIQGHTRLFLLYADISGNPASMSYIKEKFGKIAYEQGVRQIIDLSSASVTTCGKQGMIGYVHTTGEEKLWALADENPQERSLVVLRPGSFMTNQLRGDVHQIKRSNKIVSCGPPSAAVTWIDVRDISDCAVVILTEPVEKHDRNAYDIGGETLTNEQRAAIFSKVLGRPIKYEQESIQDFYKEHLGFGMNHSVVYSLIFFGFNDICKSATPELAVIIGRPLYTLEDWLRENIKAFQ